MNDDEIPPTQRPDPPPGDPTRTSQPEAPSARGSSARTGSATPRKDPSRYRILGEHGRGGIGRVSRAHDLELGRDIAIKELIARGPIDEIRFLREAIITARLEHPGIVPVHEAGRWPDGTPFYAMKLVAGRSLRDLINERNKVEERIGLLHQVISLTDAIAYAHGQHVIHRDLKPSNVIVGDFGETVVIDWGIAKDISLNEESSTDAPSADVDPRAELTSTGAVIGTPAYMPPEQARGESVDQRADVYAIGAMLWELCTLEKLPPNFSNQRKRILRRSRIDPDLIAIIIKAIDPSPERRYADAAALASDLKAFKAGMRISERRYSVYGILRLWARRNKTAAATSSIGCVLLLVSTLYYISNLASARHTADHLLADTRATQDLLQIRHDELILKHSQLQLTTDPSAAVDSLESYHGSDENRASQLRSEATGRGVAQLRAFPHSGSIRWIQGRSDGNIVSLGVDGTIVRTSFDARSTVLARDVAKAAAFAYTPSRHLLAYACNVTDLCLFDILHEVAIRIPPSLRLPHIIDLAFSPGATRLATISLNGELALIDIGHLDNIHNILRMDSHGGGGVLFVDDDNLAIGTLKGVTIARISGETRSLNLQDTSFWEAFPDQRELVFASTTGFGYLVGIFPLRIVTRMELCHDEVSAVSAILSRRTVAFACKEGTIGTWDIRDGTITRLAHLRSNIYRLKASRDGSFISVAGDDGIFAVYSFATGILTTFHGHHFRVVGMCLPSEEYSMFISGDARGELRAWLPPPNVVKLLSKNISLPIYGVLNHEPIVIATRGYDLFTVSKHGELRALGAHTADTPYLESDMTGQRFAAYGSSGVVEVWSRDSLSRQHIFSITKGEISRVAFTTDPEVAFVSTRSGELFRVTMDGTVTLAHHFANAVSFLQFVPRTKSLILATDDGTLWRFDDNYSITTLRFSQNQVSVMTRLPDETSLVVGYRDGQVVLLNTASGSQVVLSKGEDSIKDITASADGDTIAIASNDGKIRIGRRTGTSWDSAVSWVTLEMWARKIEFTSDGLLLAACGDGTARIYWPQHKLIALPLGTVTLTNILIGNDNESVRFIDDEGHFFEIDLTAIRLALKE